jgi:hypothetical protein
MLAAGILLLGQAIANGDGIFAIRRFTKECGFMIIAPPSRNARELRQQRGGAR